MEKSKRIRPTIDSEGVNMRRYNTYRDAMSRYNEAFKNGYYIECVALLDSILSDRLESLSNHVHDNPDSSYLPLGKLANILKGVCNKLNDELNELLPEISAWAVKRNNTVHEMAKLQPDTYLPFAERYKALKQCAAEGKKLFVKTNSAIKRYRAAIKKGTITL